jgi:hypothetical protein
MLAFDVALTAPGVRHHPGSRPLDAPKVDFFGNHDFAKMLDIKTVF